MYRRSILHKMLLYISIMYYFHVEKPIPITIHLFLSKPWVPWRRHQMETFSALLAICAGHRWIPRIRQVARSFDVFFDLHMNKRLSEQSWDLWFEMPSRPLWRHNNAHYCDKSILEPLLFGKISQGLQYNRQPIRSPLKIYLTDA